MGLLSKAGYFMGKDLYEPQPSNPKGFFESLDINGINEEILSKTGPNRFPFIGRFYTSDVPRFPQRWLANLPKGKAILAPKGIEKSIKRLIEQEPYCFKDPRFSYTLPIWEPFLKNTSFVCVFREPENTAYSIVKECRDRVYLHGLKISIEKAMEIWKNMYSRIYEKHSTKGDWLFIHYDQLFEEEGLRKLENFAGVEVDRLFPDKSLKRSVYDEPRTKEIDQIYRELCRRADYTYESVSEQKSIK